MRSASLTLLVTVGLTGALAAGVVRAQTRSGTNTPANLLQIDAVAYDRHGLPVTDLGPEDVEVWISGYRVPIEALVAVTPADDERSGRLIVLLLDDVTVAPVLTSRVREVARRFVNRMLPGDRMTVVTLNGSAAEITADRARLLRLIDAYHSPSIGVVRIDALGEQVLSTLASVSGALLEESGARKTIVGIGAAWLFDTPVPPPGVGRDLRREWLDAMLAMSTANAILYVIDPAGVGMGDPRGGIANWGSGIGDQGFGMRDPGLGMRDQGLRSRGFARETGGHAFVNTNDLTAAADRILREAGSYYLITVIDPPVGRTADLRELDVRVLRRGVTVRARRGIPGHPSSLIPHP